MYLYQLQFNQRSRDIIYIYTFVRGIWSNAIVGISKTVVFVFNAETWRHRAGNPECKIVVKWGTAKTSWNPWVRTGTYEYELLGTHEDILGPCQFSLPSPWWTACPAVEVIPSVMEINTHLQKLKDDSWESGAFAGPGVAPDQRAEPADKHQHEWTTEGVCSSFSSKYTNGSFFTSAFQISLENISCRDFPGGAMVKNLPANAGDTGSRPGLEDPTCRGATKPASHNYWACAPRARALQQEATAIRSPNTATNSSPRSPQLEIARAQQWRPNTAKNKKYK